MRVRARTTAAQAIVVVRRRLLPQRLLVKYNIGTFIDDRERIRKTAARVGLGIPEFHTPPSNILEKYQNALAQDVTKNVELVERANNRRTQ